MAAEKLALGIVLRSGSDAETSLQDGTVIHVAVLDGRLLCFIHKGGFHDEPLVSFPVTATSIPLSDIYCWVAAPRTVEHETYISQGIAY